jgi:hypothetical protein
LKRLLDNLHSQVTPGSPYTVLQVGIHVLKLMTAGCAEQGFAAMHSIQCMVHHVHVPLWVSVATRTTWL